MDFGGYKASPWQNEFHSLPHDEAFGAGSSGPGKSWCLLAEPIEQIVIEHNRCLLDRKDPNYHPWGSSVGWALYLRRTTPMLAEALDRAKRLFPGVDPDVKWSQQDHTFYFKSGYKYQFGHCVERDDWLQYQGRRYTILCVDELPQFEEHQYTMIKVWVRTSDPILRSMKKVRAMGNPLVTREGGDDFSVSDPWWVRRYFVDPWPDGRRTIRKPIVLEDGTKTEHTRIYLPARLSDNPDADYRAEQERNLRSLPRHIRKALLDGDWYSVAGAHYSEFFLKERHVCAPFKVPREWVWMRSMDWGYKNPGVIYWAAEDPDGTLFVVKEMMFVGQDATTVAKRVKDVETHLDLWDREKNRSLITGPADTQLWEERGNRACSMAEEFNRVGVFWVKADKHRRFTNAQRLIKRLRTGIDDAKTLPGIVFFSGCTQILKTLPAIPSDPHDPESPLKGPNGGHAHECLLYLVAYATRDHAPPRDPDDEGGDKDDGVPPSSWGGLGYGALDLREDRLGDVECQANMSGVAESKRPWKSVLRLAFVQRP